MVEKSLQRYSRASDKALAVMDDWEDAAEGELVTKRQIYKLTKNIEVVF